MVLDIPIGTCSGITLYFQDLQNTNGIELAIPTALK